MRHFELLFEKLEASVGSLGDQTSTGIVGFSAGGPVSVLSVPGESVYVTCELSLYEDQIQSSQGMRYELLSRIPIGEEETHALLTALGNLSMEAKLGHGHTIDVKGLSGVPSLELVSLQQFSSTTIDDQHYGIYEVNARQWREA